MPKADFAWNPLKGERSGVEENAASYDGAFGLGFVGPHLFLFW